MSELSPYSASKPPKTITKVTDDRFLDFTCLHTWILLSTIGLCLGIFSQLSRLSQAVQVAGVALIVVIVVAWFHFFGSFEKVDKQKLRVKFFVKGIQGKHIINKFDVPVSFLEKLVPIVEIHNGGIIEFKGNKYGLLMETHPFRISDGNERQIHEKKIEKVVNGIPANTHFKTVACSRSEPRKPILRYLLEVANKSTGDKATDLHLTGLYNKIAEDNSQVISWRYMLF